MANVMTWEIIWSDSDVNHSGIWGRAWILEPPIIFHKHSHSLAETFPNSFCPSALSLHMRALSTFPGSSTPVFPSGCAHSLSLTQEKINIHPLQTHPVRNESMANYIMIPPGTEMALPGLHRTFFYIISFEPYCQPPKGKKNKYLMSHMQSTVLEKHTFSFL